MKFVVLVAHGSRQEKENNVFDNIVEMVRDMLGCEYCVEGAFMSFSDMNIEYKLEEVIKKGATEICIVPYLLFAGNHVKETIPSKVNTFMANYPNIQVTIKDSLGIDKRLAEIVVDRIKK